MTLLSGKEKMGCSFSVPDNTRTTEPKDNFQQQDLKSKVKIKRRILDDQRDQIIQQYGKDLRWEELVVLMALYRKTEKKIHDLAQRGYMENSFRPQIRKEFEQMRKEIKEKRSVAEQTNPDVISLSTDDEESGSKNDVEGTDDYCKKVEEDICQNDSDFIDEIQNASDECREDEDVAASDIIDQYISKQENIINQRQAERKMDLSNAPHDTDQEEHGSDGPDGSDDGTYSAASEEVAKLLHSLKTNLTDNPGMSREEMQQLLSDHRSQQMELIIKLDAKRVQQRVDIIKKTRERKNKVKQENTDKEEEMQQLLEELGLDNDFINNKQMLQDLELVGRIIEEKKTNETFSDEGMQTIIKEHTDKYNAFKSAQEAELEEQHMSVQERLQRRKRANNEETELELQRQRERQLRKEQAQVIGPSISVTERSVYRRSNEARKHQDDILKTEHEHAHHELEERLKKRKETSQKNGKSSDDRSNKITSTANYGEGDDKGETSQDYQTKMGRIDEERVIKRTSGTSATNTALPRDPSQVLLRTEKEEGIMSDTTSLRESNYVSKESNDILVDGQQRDGSSSTGLTALKSEDQGKKSASTDDIEQEFVWIDTETEGADYAGIAREETMGVNNSW